jgi:hypothetical protein
MTIKQQGGVFGRNPRFNNIEVDGTGTVDGDLTVNGFSYFNDRLSVTDDHVRVIRSANTSRLEVGVDATSAYLKASFSSGGTRDLRFLSLSSEIARITANGLTFNGDTAAANALDDYEEGTWTVELYDAASGGNASATTATGYYTKTGRQVTIWFSLPNIDTTGMTAGNVMYVDLPFATGSGNISTGAVVTDNVSFGSTGTALYLRAGSGAARASFKNVTSAAGDGNAVVSHFSTGVADIDACTMTYFV